jgi:hypothetical protein
MGRSISSSESTFLECLLWLVGWGCEDLSSRICCTSGIASMCWRILFRPLRWRFRRVGLKCSQFRDRYFSRLEYLQVTARTKLSQTKISSDHNQHWDISRALDLGIRNIRHRESDSGGPSPLIDVLSAPPHHNHAGTLLHLDLCPSMQTSSPETS